MSIIDDVRIKQDLDKDGKYVCDLNHKEETKFDINLRKVMSSNESHHIYHMGSRLSLNVDGVFLPGKGTMPPDVLVGIAHQWLLHAKKYGWSIKGSITNEAYISNLIAELQKLV